MKAVCRHCGHIQTLKPAYSRRISKNGEELFQCSECHRYSSISISKINVSKEISINKKDPIVEIASNLIRKGLKKLGFMQPEKEKEPIPKPEPEKKEPKEVIYPQNKPEWS